MKIHSFVTAIVYVTAYSVIPSLAIEKTNRALSDKDIFLRYGDAIIIQNGFMDNRWLSGSRSTGNEKVVTFDGLGSEYEIKLRATYKWIIQSNAKGQSQKDLSKDCLRYGDKFLLKNDVTTDRWLNGGRGDGNAGVLTRNLFQNSYELEIGNTSYKWIARSNSGIGTRNNNENTDLAYGSCIEKNSLVYLQNNGLDNRWLSGSRGENNASVLTRNLFQSSYEKNNVKMTYTWILKTEFGEGDRFDSLTCATISSAGKWVPIAYSNAPQVITVTEGVEESRTNVESFDRSTQWSSSVTRSITSGFTFEGFESSISFEVSESISGSYATSVSQAVSKTANSQFSHSIDLGAGQIWKFVYEIRDLCYDGNWLLHTNSVVVTSGRHEPPCCLPGNAANIGIAHGACLQGSPCSCSKDVCDAEVKGCGGLRG